MEMPLAIQGLNNFITDAPLTSGALWHSQPYMTSFAVGVPTVHSVAKVVVVNFVRARFLAFGRGGRGRGMQEGITALRAKEV